MTEQDVTTEPRWKAAGPPYLLTRDELLQELHSSGYDLSERRLRDWATEQILPRPVHRLPAQATDGIARALYPAFMVAVIKDLLDAEASRKTTSRASLRKLAPQRIQYWQARYGDAPEVKDATTRVATQTVQITPLSVSDAGAIHAKETSSLRATSTGTSSVTATLTVSPAPAHRLRDAVWGYAARFAERNGSRVTEATLTLQTEEGISVTIPIHPHAQR